MFTSTHCNRLVSLCLHLHTAIALYRFVYIYTLQLSCIAWIEIKGSLISLHILVTNLHFTDRNWISKIVISKAVLYAAFRIFSYANHMKDYTGKDNPSFLCDHVGFTSKNVHFFLPKQVNISGHVSLSCFSFSCDLSVIVCFRKALSKNMFSEDKYLVILGELNSIDH